MPTKVVMSRVTDTGVDRAELTIAAQTDLTGLRIRIRSLVEVRVNDVLLRAKPCNVSVGVEEMKRAMKGLQDEGYEIVSTDRDCFAWTGRNARIWSREALYPLSSFCPSFISCKISKSRAIIRSTWPAYALATLGLRFSVGR